MTKLLLPLPLAFVALLIACENGDGGEVSPTVDVTPAGEEVCQPNPDPATPESQVIDQPRAGDTVTSPVTISGQVAAYEATYLISIFDAAGDPIVETFGTAEAGGPGELAPFSSEVAFDVDEATPACIWVYEESVQDGGPVHVGQIPVTLSP